MIIDSESLGKNCAQCGEVGEQGNILLAVARFFDDAVIQQIGEIIIQTAGK